MIEAAMRGGQSLEEMPPKGHSIEEKTAERASRIGWDMQGKIPERASQIGWARDIEEKTPSESAP